MVSAMDTAIWRLILNGKSAGESAVREAVQAAREQGRQLEVRVTWEDGDAQRYVEEAVVDDVAVIIAAGGDGTLSEVAEAMADSPLSADDLPALALMPLGTANDFATAAGIDDDPQLALALINDTHARPIDLLRLQGDGQVHWCANLASGGFGTEVTVETPDGLKKMLGGLAYVFTGVSKLGNIEAQQARFAGEGFDWEGEFIVLGIGNGRQAGGGQQLCPQALLDDGLLDLTIVPPLGNDLLASLGTLLSQGKQAALDEVATRAALPWVEITAGQPLTLNLDGEPMTARHFRIDCVPGRVRMHLPPATQLASAR
jgi:lipid kinase YegS